MSSKSVEQAVEIQTSYAKRAYDDYMQQMTKIGGMYASMAKEPTSRREDSPDGGGNGPSPSQCKAGSAGPLYRLAPHHNGATSEGAEAQAQMAQPKAAIATMACVSI
jgi:hypothetical protein